MAKNTAPVAAPVNVTEEGMPDFSKWSEEQIGFAPYWSPEPGESIFATVLVRDERSADFERYILRCEQPRLMCKRGKAINATEVEVKKGDSFTVSIYDSIEEAFDFYIASGLQPRIQLTAEEKIPTNTPGRSVWKWKLMVDPTVRPALDKLRAGVAAKQMSNGKKEERPALEG